MSATDGGGGMSSSEAFVLSSSVARRARENSWMSALDGTREACRSFAEGMMFVRLGLPSPAEGGPKLFGEGGLGGRLGDGFRGIGVLGAATSTSALPRPPTMVPTVATSTSPVVLTTSWYFRPMLAKICAVSVFRESASRSAATNEARETGSRKTSGGREVGCLATAAAAAVAWPVTK